MKKQILDFDRHWSNVYFTLLVNSKDQTRDNIIKCANEVFNIFVRRLTDKINFHFSIGKVLKKYKFNAESIRDCFYKEYRTFYVLIQPEDLRYYKWFRLYNIRFQTKNYNRSFYV